jgi:hypothetical protein
MDIRDNKKQQKNNRNNVEGANKRLPKGVVLVVLLLFLVVYKTFFVVYIKTIFAVYKNVICY